MKDKLNPDLPRVFHAYGAGNKSGPYKPTPLEAVKAFLERHPGARKISVQEMDNNADGSVTIAITALCGGKTGYKSWKDLSPKAALALPDERSFPKTPFNYNDWVDEQAEKIGSATNRLACSGIMNAAVYAFKSDGATPGFLTVEVKQPEGACDVVCFGAHSDKVMMVPRSHLRSLLWHACRNLPICPTA